MLAVYLGTDECDREFGVFRIKKLFKAAVFPGNPENFLAGLLVYVVTHRKRLETATFANFASFERVIIFTSENRKFFGAQFIESKCALCYYNSKHFGGMSI